MVPNPVSRKNGIAPTAKRAHAEICIRKKLTLPNWVNGLAEGVMCDRSARTEERWWRTSVRQGLDHS